MKGALIITYFFTYPTSVAVPAFRVPYLADQFIWIGNILIYNTNNLIIKMGDLIVLNISNVDTQRKSCRNVSLVRV